jgi:hypothetical protein
LTSERKFIQSVKNLENVFSRLKAALQEDESNSLFIDGTIHRFEFSIGLYWKTLKRLLDLDRRNSHRCLVRQGGYFFFLQYGKSKQNSFSKQDKIKPRRFF